MKKYRLLAALLVVALLAGGCIAAKYAYQANKDKALAVYDGTLNLPGLKEKVEVWRDSYAVPHIIAQNEDDLYYAIGYVQAQDRLFEMMLLRAMAEGRTAELLGVVKVPGQSFKGFPIDTLKIDAQQRTMGMKYVGEVGEALYKEYNPAMYKKLQAYSDGINEFLRTHSKMEQLPIEFQILGVKPAPWRPADVISLNRLMGFILGYNMLVELWRYAIMANYGEDIGWEIAGIHNHYGEPIVPKELLKNRLAEPRAGLPPGGRPSEAEMGYSFKDLALVTKQLYVTLNFVRETVSADLPFASNNWVVNGKMSATGSALFANDSHMLRMEPSMYYLSHVKGGDVDSFGVAFPGTPFHALGHTRHVSWGATTSIADAQDMYVETLDPAHPGAYLYQGEWKPFTIRKEKISVRGAPDREVTIRQTVHGPIISDFLPLPKGSPAMSLRWTAWDFSRDPKMFDLLVSSSSVEEFMAKMKAEQNPPALINMAMAMDRLMKGKSIDDFNAAMDLMDMPNMNWGGADSAGHIAYVPGGLVPLRKKGIGAMPSPGASGDFDWTGFIPTAELPQLQDPERGYIVTANNEVVDAEWYPYMFSINFDGGWRALRINQLIEKLAPLDMADMKTIQNDIHVTKAAVELPIIFAAVEKVKPTDPETALAVKLLKEWDLEASVDSIATGVFFNYVEQMRRNTFVDELGEDDFWTYMHESHADIVVEQLMKKGGSFLFDDVRTPQKETMDDIICRSLHDAVVFMQKNYGEDTAKWRWGTIHQIIFFNPLGMGPFRELSVGPIEVPGSRHTLRCASPAESGKLHFKDMNGTSIRHIVDMNDVDHSQMVIDGSISGQWLSPHYTDMHYLWASGNHLTASMDQETIEQEARYHLVMEP